MALQSIASFCGNNLPGLYTIEYVSTSLVDAAVYRKRLNGHNWDSGVPFISGDWLKAPVFYRPDQLWTQQGRETQQGRSYLNVVSGQIPQLQVSIDEQLEEMANHSFLLRLLDRNGKYWLLGTLETPFYFTTNSTAGNNTQRAQYELQWEAELPQRVYGFIA